MHEYQRQDIATSSPLQLIVRIYDVAITACHRNDRRKLRQALTELIGALNMEEGGEISARLYRLYEFCMDESVQGDLEPVREILTELRETWRSLATVKKAA